MELWIRNVTTHYPWLIRGSCWINNSKQRTKGNCYANCSPPRPDKGQITGFQFHPESLNQLPRKEDHMQFWKLPIVVVLSLDLRDSTAIIPTIPNLFSFWFLFSFSLFKIWQNPHYYSWSRNKDTIQQKAAFVAVAPWKQPSFPCPCSCKGSSLFWRGGGVFLRKGQVLLALVIVQPPMPAPGNGTWGREGEKRQIERSAELPIF